jgi:uncharacterized protein (DUF433 family)
MRGDLVCLRRAGSGTGRSGRPELSGCVRPGLVQADPVVTWLVTGLRHHAVRLAWRYAFITAALDAGVPLGDVQEAASHADPRTTMRQSGPGPRWTATPLTSSPPTSPEPHVRHRIAALVYARPSAEATHRAGAAGAGRRTLKDMAYERITIDPAKMTGLPCIRDTRVTVSAVLGQLAAGRSTEQILADYPYLERADILAALEFAAAAVQERELPLARPA